MIENGVVRQNVNLVDFSVGGSDFGRGVSEFNGELVHPLPLTEQDEKSAELYGWGCGVFATINTLGLFGIEVKTEKALSVAYGLGLTRGGMDGDIMVEVLRHFGLKPSEQKLLSLNDYEEVFAKGGVVVTTVIEEDWGKMYRSRLQSYESHWVVIPAVDKRGVLVMDSDLRELEKGGLSYGLYSMPWKSFAERNREYWPLVGGGHISVSEDFVWGKSRWYHNDALVVMR